MAGRVVIAGASHAGVAVADALRRQGFAGDVVLLSDEVHAPYQRPLLSKTPGYLELPPERASLKAASFYVDSAVDLRRGVGLEKIDTRYATVTLSNAEEIRFDHLVLAVGAEPRRFSAAVVSGNPPIYLRSLDDARHLHARLKSSGSIGVIGGGLIGLEVAALAAAQGRAVTVFETASSLMGRVVPQEISDWIELGHRSAGIRFRLASAVKSLRGDNRGYEIETETNGVELFDDVIVAIGTIPRVAVAKDAGLKTGNGVCVTVEGRASEPGIWAVGDCADWGGLEGVGQRYEGVQPALEQARTVARAICGLEAVAPAVPRYWSHQGALRLQTAGALLPNMELVAQHAEAGGICLLGMVDGIPKACFAVDAALAYRDAVKLLDSARLPIERAPAA